LNKLLLNESKFAEDLENNWAVVAEAIQTILRREGFPKPYEKLKELSRVDRRPGKEEFKEFIDNLEIEEHLKQELHAITPFNYLGK
jgi:adenylosuccinate lyase